MKHKLKLREDFIEPVLSGQKTFEIRLNDRGYNKGDTVTFEAVSRYGVPYSDTELSDKEYIITYVLSGFGLEKDHVAFGITERGVKDETD